MTKVVERPKQETLTRPPRRWRNWWCALERCVEDNGKRHSKGEEFAGQFVFPSKEVAEQKAVEVEIEDFRRFGRVAIKHIGAYAEGERP